MTPDLELLLKRRWLTLNTTIGELFICAPISPVFECFILEDRYRGSAPKVPKQTCIPLGRYEVQINMSPKFNRPLPLLLNVPGFNGIRIHAGNVAADTEGCLLPGRERITDKVLESRSAFDSLFAKLRAAQGKIFITLELGAP